MNIYYLIVIAGSVVAAWLLIRRHLVEEYEIPPLHDVVLAWITRGRHSTGSRYPVFARRLRRALSSCRDIGIDGTTRAVKTIVVWAAPADLDEALLHTTRDELARDVARAYRRIADTRNWNRPSDVMEIYLVADNLLRPNFPRVTSGRRPGVSDPVVVDLSPVAISASSEANLEPVPEESLAALMDRTPVLGPLTEADLDLWQGAAEAEDWMDEPTKPASDVPCLRLGPGVACILRPSGTSIGRDPANDLVIDDPTVSRAHAAISQLDGGWVLTPFQEHKCIVNGEVIWAPAELRHGDRISFARSSEIFVVETHAWAAS